MDRTKYENLSREEKLRLYDLIQEKKKRLKSVKSTLTPLPEQKEILSSNVYERIVTCGNGFGKTTVAVHEAMWRVQGYHPIKDKLTRVPATILVGLDKPDKIAQRWKPELDKWFNIDWAKQGKKHGKPFYQEIVFPNGSNILFFFHDQDPMTFESIEGDCLILDEPPPRHMYFGLSRGLRKKNTDPFILLVGTPITGSWIRKELYEPWVRGDLKDIHFFKYSSDVNKENWPPGYANRYFGRMSEKEERIRRHGEFFDLDGLALAHLFRRDIHVFEPDALEWDFNVSPCVIAIDPHTSKKNYAVLMGVDSKGDYYVLDEYAEKSTATDFAELLHERGWFDFSVVDIVYDSAGNADGTSNEGFATFGQAFNKALAKLPGAFTARGTTFKEKSDEDWIERIRNVLAPMEGQPAIRFAAHCRGTISDVENVAWTRHKLLDENKPKLDIQNKDFLNCVKYALAAGLRFENRTRKRIYRLKKQPYIGDRGKDLKRAKIIKTGFRRYFR